MNEQPFFTILFCLSLSSLFLLLQKGSRDRHNARLGSEGRARGGAKMQRQRQLLLVDDRGGGGNQACLCRCALTVDAAVAPLPLVVAGEPLLRFREIHRRSRDKNELLYASVCARARVDARRGRRGVAFEIGRRFVVCFSFADRKHPQHWHLRSHRLWQDHADRAHPLLHGEDPRHSRGKAVEWFEDMTREETREKKLFLRGRLDRSNTASLLFASTSKTLKKPQKHTN